MDCTVRIPTVQLPYAYNNKIFLAYAIQTTSNFDTCLTRVLADPFISYGQGIERIRRNSRLDVEIYVLCCLAKEKSCISNLETPQRDTVVGS